MTPQIPPAKTHPVSRDELVAALRHAELTSPGAARTTSEITARVAARRGTGDVGVRAYHVTPVLRELVAEVDSPIVEARGSHVRFFATLPPKLGHTTVYYVWRTRAEQHKVRYDEKLRRRAATITAAEKWQRRLGKRGTARAADMTVIVEVTPEMALDILAASERILPAATTHR
jgi:hypothetical protein